MEPEKIAISFARNDSGITMNIGGDVVSLAYWEFDALYDTMKTFRNTNAVQSTFIANRTQYQ